MYLKPHFDYKFVSMINQKSPLIRGDLEGCIAKLIKM